MPMVSVEQDASYRREGDRFVETCRACGVDRMASPCACGATFERAKVRWFATSRPVTTVRPRMPPICPHCEGVTNRVRSITIVVPVGITRGRASADVPVGVSTQRFTLEFATCAKMLPPFAAYMLLITAMFFVVVFGLASVFGHGLPTIALTLLAMAAAVAAWRAYGWLRFAGVDHRAVRLRARRPGYAIAVADLNRGCIRGQIVAPPRPATPRRSSAQG